MNKNSSLDGVFIARAWLASLLLVLTASYSVSRAENRINISSEAVEKRLRADVKYLSSDELEGRGLTTKGLVLASEHIAKTYEQSGLKTELFHGKPFHTFNTRSWRALGEGNRLTLVGPNGKEISWVLGESYRPITLGRDGEFDAELVFSGYGITGEKEEYDDFANVDVKGKAVVIMRHEPQQENPESPFAGTKNSQHAYLVRKVQNAANHGAALVILCNDHHALSKEGATDSLLPFAVKANLATRPIPVVHALRKALSPAITNEQLKDWESRIDADLKPHSQAIDGWVVKGRVATKREGNQLRNVVGLLEPDGEATETVIVGAHYDHLGRGGSGSLAPWTRAIHNGADDNASGTSVLLEVARQIGQRRDELKRRVLFIAFSAEESGLIGSARYVRSPLYPMDETAAMVNLDMVGRLGEQPLTVYGTGTGNGFATMADQLGEQHGLKIKKISSGYGPSDHASFHAAGVPVFHLFTGLHADYHRPSDDYDKIDYEGMQRITQLTVDMVMELATSTEKTRRKKRTKADSTPAPKPLKKGTTTLGLAVRDHEGGGCLVTQVVKDGPGDQAGIRIGDVISKWDETSLSNLKSMQTQIADRKAGDVVTLTIQRESLRLKVKVTLGVVK